MGMAHLFGSCSVPFALEAESDRARLAVPRSARQDHSALNDRPTYRRNRACEALVGAPIFWARDNPGIWKRDRSPRR
jgi:hypothetical protein